MSDVSLLTKGHMHTPLACASLSHAHYSPLDSRTASAAIAP